MAEAMKEVVDALKEQSKAGSGKGTVDKFSSGANVIEDMKKMAADIATIKKDMSSLHTKQDKVLAELKELRKQRQGGVFEKVNSKGKDGIMAGIKVIMLISAAVLAIGLAFKLIGNVNFKTVVAMAIALPLLAIAFEKIGKAKIPSWMAIFKFAVLVPIVALALTKASWIMSLMATVTVKQALTGIAISIMMAIVSLSIGKLAKSIKGLNNKAILALSVVIPIIAASIVGASWVLSKIQPVEPMALLTAIGISIALAIISFGFGKLLDGAAKMTPKAMAAIPLVVATIFASIWIATQYLTTDEMDKGAQSLDYEKLFNIVLIGIAVGVIGFAMAIPIKILKGMKPKDAMNAGIAFVAIMGVILIASWAFELINTVSVDKLLTAAEVGLALGVAGLAMMIPLIVMSKVNPKDAVMGALGLIIIATVVMIAGLLFSLVDEWKSPPFEFVLVLAALAGIGLLLIPLGAALPTVILGVVALIVLSAGIWIAMLILEQATGAMKAVGDNVASTLDRIVGSVTNAFSSPVFSDIGNAATFMISLILVGVGLLVFSLMLSMSGILNFISQILDIDSLFVTLGKAIPYIDKVQKMNISDMWVTNMGLIGEGIYELASALPGVTSMGTTAAIMESILKTLDVVGKTLPLVKRVNAFTEDELKEFGTKLGLIGESVKELASNLPGKGDMGTTAEILDKIHSTVKVASSIIPLIREVNKIEEEEITNFTQRLLSLGAGLAGFASLLNKGSGFMGIGTTISSVATGVDRLADAIKKLKDELTSTSFLKPLRNLAESLVIISIIDPEKLTDNVTALENVLNKVNPNSGGEAEQMMSSYAPKPATAGGGGGGGGASEEKEFTPEDFANAVSDALKESLKETNDNIGKMAGNLEKLYKIQQELASSMTRNSMDRTNSR